LLAVAAALDIERQEKAQATMPTRRSMSPTVDP
jgi:hypothetical protein